MNITLSNDVLQIAKHFFAALVRDQDMSAEVAVTLLPSYFLGWCSGHLNLHPVDPSEFCALHNVSYESWQAFRTLVDNPVVEAVWKVWPQICLSMRSAPVQALESMQISVLFKWRDGTIAPVTVRTLSDMSISGVLDDATVATLLRAQIESLVALVMANGLDQIYTRGEHYGGEHPFEVMMGMLLKMKDQIAPQIRPFYERYLRLAQRLIRAPIPPQALSQLQQEKEAARRSANPDEPIRGGWAG